MEIETVNLLKKVYKTDNTALIISGTGTYGMEMTLRSLFEPGERIAVVNGGIFGAVAISIARIVGLDPVSIDFEEGCHIDVDRIRDVVLKDDSIKAVYVAHDETTTGIMAPLREIGEVCRERDLLFIVDAISSISGADLRTDEWGIDVCIASAQKCMNGPQGLVLLAVSDKAYAKMNARKTPIDSLSLDLGTWTRYHETKVKGYLDWWKKGGKPPVFDCRAPHEVSPPCTLVWGLQGALEDILAEGLDRRFARHAVAGKAMREGIKAMGANLFTEECAASEVVTVVALPHEIDERELREFLLNKHHLAIGNGEVAHTVRIGTMGITASEKYVLPCLSSLADGLSHFGLKTDAGAGLAAAATLFCA